jgi:hypothetical protein
MTLRQFAESIINDPAYRDTVATRARAGTLPPDVELFLLEIADFAGERNPVAPRARVRPAPQSPTLALVRPSTDGEGIEHE